MTQHGQMMEVLAAQGNSVYVTWWDTNNQTGLREPVFIASNDNGNTFGERVVPVR